MTYPVVRVLQHKPAVDLRPALRAVRVNVGLCQLALHLLVDKQLLNDLQIKETSQVIKSDAL